MSPLDIDLTDCPSGWSDFDGFDRGEIVLASHGGSGASGHSDGLSAYFDEVNANGGVLGRQLRLEHINIAPGDAVQYLQGLTWALDQNPLAVSAVGGTAVSPEMAERVDDACIPNLFWQNLVAVPNPAARAWTVHGFQSIEVEVAIWLVWIVETFGSNAAIVAVAMDNSWGERWLDAIEAERASTAPSASLKVIRHDPSAPDLIDALAGAADSNADVLLGATAGNPCLRLLVDRVDIAELADKAVLLPSVCSFEPATVIPAGQAAGNVFFADLIGSRPEPDEFLHSSYWHGWLSGYLAVEALELADTLPGGLSRSNLLRAAKAIERAHPLLDGATIASGPERSGAIKQWSVAEQAWLDHGGQPFVVTAVQRSERQDPDCESTPLRSQVTASGWVMNGDRLDPDSEPSVTIDGLGLAIERPEGVGSGWIKITSSDVFTFTDVEVGE